MSDYRLEELVNRLERMKERYQPELDSMPSGKLLCDKGANSNRYYIASEVKGRYGRRGITKDKELVRLLARKEFLRQTLSVIEHDLKVARRAQRQYKACDPTSIVGALQEKYNNIPAEYFFDYESDANTNDLDIDTATRIAAHDAWGEEKFHSDSYMMEGRTLLTTKGIYMRSKAEVLIAEKLLEYKIPFRYEQPLYLSTVTLHPDFTFEGRNGEPFYLEFCGMMDDSEYVSHFFHKRRIYESEDIYEWKNMIYIYAVGNELNMMYIDAIIRTRVIPWL